MEIPRISNILAQYGEKPKTTGNVGKDFATILLNEMLKSANVFEEEGGLNYTGMFRFQMAQKLSEALSKSVDFSGLGDLKDIAEKIADEEGVDRALVKAVIETESGWNKDAVSEKGAKGLMQLMDATAERFGVISVFNPVENIKGGVKFLSTLIKKYDGDIEKTLAAYNAGEGNVEKYGGVPPFEETQEYIKRILDKLS